MNPSPSPNFALLTSADFSNIASKVASRGATAVTSTWSSDYEDMISFLNGRGMASGIDLSAQLLASSNFGTSWNVGIDANDKLEISSDIAFKIRYHSGSTLDDVADVFNFGTSFVNSGGASGIGPKLANAVSASGDWVRGEIVSLAYEIVQTSGGSNSFFFNFTGGAQDLIVACRSRGNGDIDDLNTATLEGADVTATSADVRWFINNNGHVTNTAITGTSAWSWNTADYSLRDYLGFTGEETTTSVNSYDVLTATHPCNGVLVPSRPYQQNHINVDNVAQSRRRIGGGYTSNYIGTYRTSVLGFDLDARLDLIDLYQHFIHKWLPYASEGERVNFYQTWGDSRRSLITGDVVFGQLAHDLIYTSSRNGFEGRIRASIVSNQFDLMFPLNLRRRVPVTMRLEHLNE
tara:strand:- start:2446 stop:3663 length:1218 start_codon:yes stop_codon:yes gene_type:complete